jgi:uncharacterized protein (TIGR02118 family)
VVKLIVLLPRREDMSPEEFERYAREQHLPILTKLPGLRRLVVNRVLPDPTGPPPAYDAIAEDWFDDLQALGAAFASPEGQAVAADAPNFLDMTRFQVMVVEEVEVPLPMGIPAASPGRPHCIHCVILSPQAKNLGAINLGTRDSSASPQNDTTFA